MINTAFLQKNIINDLIKKYENLDISQIEDDIKKIIQSFLSLIFC